jgi:hypothetical protein
MVESGGGVTSLVKSIPKYRLMSLISLVSRGAESQNHRCSLREIYN